MGRVPIPTIGSNARGPGPVPLAPPPSPRSASASASRTVLGALLSRALSKLGGSLERVGRLSLYVGLLLVTFQALRLPGNFGSIADPFLLVSLLCAFFLAARGRAFNIAIFKLHGLGLLLICAGVLTSTVANATDDWQSVANLIKFGFTTTGTFFACVILLKHRAQLKTALGCWVMSAAISGLIALLQLWYGQSIAGFENQSWGRLAALTGNPNGLGAVAAMALAPGVTLAVLSQRTERILWVVAVLLCVAGVILSASRAGAIVALATLIPWLLWYFRVNKELAVVIAGCCVLAASAAFYFYVDMSGGQDVTARLANASDPYADGAVASRLHQYAAVLREASFLGSGLASDDAAVYGQEVHNTFLLFLRTGGVLAFVGIAIIASDLLWRGARVSFHTANTEVRLLGFSLTLGVCGLLLTALAGPMLYQRKEWVPAALLFALIALTRGHRRAPPTRRASGSRNRASRARRHRKIAAEHPIYHA